MIYVALLRGINVGGNNKVDMKKLKASFESVGMQNVVTYINSGNIIFSDQTHQPDEIVTILEKVIEQDFKLAIKVIVRSFPQFKEVINHLPAHWKNNQDMKSDVMFLWEDVDSPTIMEQFTIKPDLDDVVYIPGAVLWSTPKQTLTKSGKMKLAGSKIYKKMTIRNVNTTRKIFEIMQVHSTNE